MNNRWAVSAVFVVVVAAAAAVLGAALTADGDGEPPSPTATPTTSPGPLSAPESTATPSSAATSPTSTTTAPSTTTTTTSTSTTTTTTAPLAAVPLFGVPTGVALVFDNGGDGVVVVHPDRGTRGNVVVPGNVGGDPPYRLEEVDGQFVVGWGEVYAVDTATLNPKFLGRATIFLPAAEPGMVWLVDYPQGFIGGGSAVVWQVHTDGSEVGSPVTIGEEGFPAIGIPGGVALETSDGVALWDLGTESVTGRLGSGNGFVADGAGSLLAWCSGECTRMHISDLIDGTDVVAESPDEAPFGTFAFGARAARFSPDATMLAAVAGPAVVLIDTTTGDAEVVGDLPGSPFPSFLAWTADGAQLYASTFSYGEQSTALLRYDVATQRTDTALLPFGGTLSFVVLGTAAADELVQAAGVDPVRF